MDLGARIARSIPAWAGETISCGNCVAQRTVYPRVGGGNKLHMSGNSNPRGLSPRGRGKRAREPPAMRCAGSIPAWAGETAG